MQPQPLANYSIKILAKQIRQNKISLHSAPLRTSCLPVRCQVTPHPHTHSHSVCTCICQIQYLETNYMNIFVYILCFTWASRCARFEFGRKHGRILCVLCKNVCKRFSKMGFSWETLHFIDHTFHQNKHTLPRQAGRVVKSPIEKV